MSRLIYVTNSDGDWEAIYIDGKLHHEGQSIPAYVWFAVTGICLDRNEFEVKSEWLGSVGGTFPSKFEDIPECKFA